MNSAAHAAEDAALLVELGGRTVGTLRRESDGSLSFAYAESWLAGGFALTRGLPLDSKPKPASIWSIACLEPFLSRRVTRTNRRD